jgi:hypothetical protein
LDLWVNRSFLFLTVCRNPQSLAISGCSMSFFLLILAHLCDVLSLLSPRLLLDHGWVSGGFLLSMGILPSCRPVSSDLLFGILNSEFRTEVAMILVRALGEDSSIVWKVQLHNSYLVKYLSPQGDFR